MEKRDRVADVGSVFGMPLMAALLAVVLFVATAKSALPLAAFAGAALFLILGSRAWAKVGLSRLEASLSVGRERVFPGECVEVRAELVNNKPLPVWARLELPVPGDLQVDAEGFVGGTASLLPFERARGSWTLRAGRRGVFGLGPATLAAGDILGLYRAERRLGFDREIVVFPRLVPIREIELPFRFYFGIHPSKGLIEDPAWYEGTREYTGLRPAKNIHWKASAHLGLLQEKVFQPTSHRKVVFALEGRGFRWAEDEGGFEAALELLASLASRFAESGASFAMATDRAARGFPSVLPLGRGPEHLGRALELMARCTMEPGIPVIRLLGGIGEAGASYVVLAREPDEGAKRFFALPHSRRDRILFLFAKGAEEAARDGLPAVAFEDLAGPGPQPAALGEEP